MTGLTAALHRVDPATSARRVAAAATMLAGAVHYAVVPGHRAAWWWLAVGFTLVGGCQLAWGVAAWRLTRRGLLRAGLVLNTTAVIVWATSRIWGVPVGPHAGHDTGLAAADLVCVGCELVAVAALAMVLNLREAGQPRS